MNRNRGPWHKGQEAWNRLEMWYQGASAARAFERSADQDALKALEDSGLVRRMLDQIEFEAVRTARRNGKSWAEIAVKLGVTRQSAWERWRDVDESATEAAGSRAPGPNVAEADLPMPEGMGPMATAGSPHGGGLADAGPSLSKSQARSLRRRATVVVPNVIGMPWDVARKVLAEKDLLVEGPDPDGPPISMLGWPDGVVVDQSPESGAKVPLGAVVRLWVERGDGGSGVREPRRPLPDPKSAHRMRDEITDEAVDEAIS